jgi:hypothetical protein
MRSGGFVDIGRIVDHRCINFPLIIVFNSHPLGQRKKDRIRQMTAYLKSVDLDFSSSPQ